MSARFTVKELSADKAYSTQANLAAVDALGFSVEQSDMAMKYEVAAKFVAHNLRCLISAMYELGISPVFAQAS